MKKYKKILIDAILFFVIIGLTLYGVFHGEDLSGLKDAIKECNTLWLIPAVPLVLFFIRWREYCHMAYAGLLRDLCKGKVLFSFFSGWIFL